MSTPNPTIKVYWKKGNGEAILADEIKINVFHIKGPRNVPDYAKYDYVAGGGSSNQSYWVEPVAGQLVDYDPASSTHRKATIFWGQGPVIAKARYQASQFYTWAFDVNVVKVQIDFPETGEEDPTTMLEYADQEFNHPVKSLLFPSRIDSIRGPSLFPDLRYDQQPPEGTDERLLGPAMKARLKVSRIEGPVRDGKMRGVQFIEMGFIQSLEFTTYQAVYGATGAVPVEGKQGFVFQGKTMLDTITYFMQPESTYRNPQPKEERSKKPWYDSNKRSSGAYLGVFKAADDQLIQDQVFAMSDTPMLPGANSSAVPNGAGGFSFLSRMEMDLNFDVFFAVRTTEKTRYGAEKVYTQRALAEWRFNGTGKIDGATATSFGVWTPEGAGVTGDSGFTEKIEGERVPEAITQANIVVNDKLSN